MSIQEEIPGFLNIAVEQAKSRNKQGILQQKFIRQTGRSPDKILKGKLRQYKLYHKWERKYFSKCKRLKNDNKHLQRLLSGSSMVANGNDQQPRVTPTKELSRNKRDSQSRKEKQSR